MRRETRPLVEALLVAQGSDDPLEALEAVQRARSELARLEQQIVDEAWVRNIPWRAIGEAAGGMSKQAAWRKWRHLDGDPKRPPA